VYLRSRAFQHSRIAGGGKTLAYFTAVMLEFAAVNGDELALILAVCQQYALVA